jgi:hypothetical protein
MTLKVMGGSVHIGPVLAQPFRIGLLLCAVDVGAAMVRELSA